jgi:hypothetical protein
MPESSVVELLCRMPTDFRKRRDISMIGLLKESGYLQNPDRITEQDLESHIRSNPHLVETWLSESADQRCTPAWYFLSPDDEWRGQPGSWRVGFYPGTELHEFEVGSTAYAFFIKRFAEQIRSFIT